MSKISALRPGLFDILTLKRRLHRQGLSSARLPSGKAHPQTEVTPPGKANPQTEPTIGRRSTSDAARDRTA